MMGMYLLVLSQFRGRGCAQSLASRRPYSETVLSVKSILEYTDAEGRSKRPPLARTGVKGSSQCKDR